MLGTLRLAGFTDDCVALEWKRPTLKQDQAFDGLEPQEDGAVGVGLVLLSHFYGKFYLRRGYIGDGFDYFLSDSPASNDAVPTAVVEFSGILKGSDADIRKRVRQKRRQTSLADALGLPIYVLVTCFSMPQSECHR